MAELKKIIPKENTGDTSGTFSCVIAGAGIAGGTIARLLAEKGQKVLILERRPHPAGNAFDDADEHGIRVQRYGPHIFHTDDEEVYRWITRFCEPEPYRPTTAAVIDGISTPVPLNFRTIDQFYSPKAAAELKQKLLSQYPGRDSVPVTELLQAEDGDIRQFAEFLFEKDYKLYTAKQWNLKPEEVDPSVLERVPVLLSYADRYTDRWQFVPKDGFAAFYERMIDHPNITVFLETDALKVLSPDEASGKILFNRKALRPLPESPEKAPFNSQPSIVSTSPGKTPLNSKPFQLSEESLGENPYANEPLRRPSPESQEKTSIDSKPIQARPGEPAMETPFDSEEVQVIWTGAVDELFGYRFGVLPYRSLRFDYRSLPQKSFQEAAVTAYPQAEGYTRITEYTKIPPQDGHGWTSIAVEYPTPIDPKSGSEPYYPVLTAESQALNEKYQQYAKRFTNLTLAGRLATFRYLEMNEVIKEALGDQGDARDQGDGSSGPPIR